MMMIKLTLCMLATFSLTSLHTVAHISAPSPSPSSSPSRPEYYAPAPSPSCEKVPSPYSPGAGDGTDCMALLFADMMSCVTFLTEEGGVSRPDPECCTGLETVVKSNAACICFALEQASDFGVTINMTSALAMPQLCNVVAPPMSDCGISSEAPSPADDDSTPASPETPPAPQTGISAPPSPPLSQAAVHGHDNHNKKSGAYTLSPTTFALASAVVLSFFFIFVSF